MTGFRASRLLPVIAAGTLLIGLSPAVAMASPVTSSLGDVLQRQFAATPASPGMAARVDAPGLHWAAAVGGADRSGTRPLTPAHPFRLASVTKTFTAATVLALADRGRIDLDAPIGRYLPAPYSNMLRQGGYHPERMPVRQVLNHTSGLGDHAGFWNAVALHCPGSDVAVSLTANAASSDRDAPTDLESAAALARVALSSPR